MAKNQRSHMGAVDQPLPRWDRVDKRWFRVNRAPDFSSEPRQKPICQQFSCCEGCPYPAHGFLCWRDETDCLRTRMQKINKREDWNGTECITEK